ncbi:MAG: hypothetical protein AAGF11_20785 [Myxococcota bacterium]
MRQQDQGSPETTGAEVRSSPASTSIAESRRTTAAMQAVDPSGSSTTLEVVDERRTTTSMAAVEPVEIESPPRAGSHPVTAAMAVADPGQTSTSMQAVDPGKTSTSMAAVEAPGGLRSTSVASPGRSTAAPNSGSSGNSGNEGHAVPRVRARARVAAPVRPPEGPADALENAPTVARVARQTSMPMVAAMPSPDAPRPVVYTPTGPVPVDVSRRTTASLQAVDARRITHSTRVARADCADQADCADRADDSTDGVPSKDALSAIDARRTTNPLPAAMAVPVKGRRAPAPAMAPLRSVFGRARDLDRMIDLEDLEQAMLHLEQLTHRSPRDIEAAEALAGVLVDLGAHGRASVELLRLAGLYANAGRGDEATQAITHARSLDPASLVRHRLAPVVFRLGVQGRPECERAIEGHLAAGRLDAARDLLALLVEAQPGEIEIRHRLAKTELLLGNSSAAILHLRAVVERYRDERRIAQLVPAAEELLRHDGPDAPLLWELTLIYLQADLHERALEKLEQLHRLVPSDLEIVERVANLQARLGRVHAALGSLWRLVCGMQNAGAGDAQIRDLLDRARHWSDEPRHRESIDALLRKALTRRRPAAARAEDDAGGEVDHRVVSVSRRPR